MTILAAQNEFLIDQQIKGNSKYTLTYYRLCLGYFISHIGADVEMNDIKLVDLKGYYMSIQKRNLSTISIQTYFRAIRVFLSWCFDEEYIKVDLSEKFKLPKAKRYSIDVLTDAEVQRLLAVFNKRSVLDCRNLCICSLMLDSGLRLNEVVLLYLCNLHIPEGYIIVDGKGNKQRIIPIGLHTKKAMLRYLAVRPNYMAKDEKQTPLFVIDTMTPIKRETVKQLFAKLKKRAEIPRLKAHLLRHTFATRYLEHGGDIYSLQQILGHTSLEMVKKYVHTIPRKTIINFGNFSPLDNMPKK